jgi:hypothetical protein
MNFIGLHSVIFQYTESFKVIYGFQELYFALILENMIEGKSLNMSDCMQTFLKRSD